MKETSEEFEDDYWSDSDFDSYLVLKCHQLRGKPISKFSVEDLRIMIGQNIGVEYLMPMALRIVSDNPTASGDFYEGDLLNAIVQSEFVKENPDLNEALSNICALAIKSAVMLEIEESFGGLPPSDFGLDDEAVEQIIQKRRDGMLLKQPWKRFYEFAEKFG